MVSNDGRLNRRVFLRQAVSAAVGFPLMGAFGRILAAQTEPSVAGPWPNANATRAKVAIVPCKTYGAKTVRTALQHSFDLLGGIGALVKNKTVTVKINLTGTDLTPQFDRPVGESYMTHYDTVLALAALLFDTGARRVRFVESTNSRAKLETTLALADWDLNALTALGRVEFENTRNLGLGKSYAHLRVPGAGFLFSSFDLNHSYGDTDVVVSLAKLKQHVTAGVTLSMKNIFGITPNALYGGAAGNEEAVEGRWPLHSTGTPEDPKAFDKLKLPGAKPANGNRDPGYRVPHIVADLCAARPIHLAIVDGITTMSGGEGPWCHELGKLRFLTPGRLIAGLNPVATDAVATAVMGYDPRAQRGQHPFEHCDNHLLLAEQAGAGTADLKQIEVRGLTIAEARCTYG